MALNSTLVEGVPMIKVNGAVYLLSCTFTTCARMTVFYSGHEYVFVLSCGKEVPWDDKC
jgi:hypothetical protein